MQQITSHTALRGIAALLVVWGHYTDVFARNIAGYDYFIPRTYLGVDLFFLLSGFVLYWVYVPVFGQRLRARDWGIFLQRRLARIYPLHLATLLMVLALMRFSVAPEDIGLLRQNLGLVHAWGFADRFAFNAPSWSISCEFAAYLVFPAAMVLIRHRAGAWLLAGFAVASYAVLWRLGAGSLDLDAIGRNAAILRVAGAFPLGMLVAKAYLAAPRLHKHLQTRAQLTALVALACGLWLGVPDILLIPVLAALVFFTASPLGWVSKMLAARWVQRIGDMSYGIYLIQWPLMLLMFNLRPKMAPYLTGPSFELVALAVFLGLLFGLSALSYRYFERPIVGMARRVAAT